MSHGSRSLDARRWYEIPCRNGEVVRVAFALAIDTHDREVMAPVATTGAGISGEMVRDMMLECVERRSDAVRAPEPVQRLADSCSGNAAYRCWCSADRTGPPLLGDDLVAQNWK